MRIATISAARAQPAAAYKLGAAEKLAASAANFSAASIYTCPPRCIMLSPTAQAPAPAAPAQSQAQRCSWQNGSPSAAHAATIPNTL